MTRQNPTFARGYTKTELANRISRLCEERNALGARLESAIHANQQLAKEADRLKLFLLRLNEWLGDNPHWDLHFQPEWYDEMRELMK